MIDNICILFSVGGCLFVVYQAVILDGILPWFSPAPVVDRTPAPPTAPPAAAAATWRARATTQRPGRR